jgi:hypothetical protein
MLLEKLVFSLVSRFPSGANLAVSAASTMMAVQASPKMKWLSRSRQFRWPW